MPNYLDSLAADRRLLILQNLQTCADYTAHEHLLRARLAEFGHVASADATRSLLAWLDEQGLITLLGDQVQVARLTLRGQDVADGAASVPGVARPRP